MGGLKLRHSEHFTRQACQMLKWPLNNYLRHIWTWLKRSILAPCQPLEYIIPGGNHRIFGEDAAGKGKLLFSRHTGYGKQQEPYFLTPSSLTFCSCLGTSRANRIAQSLVVCNGSRYRAQRYCIKCILKRTITLRQNSCLEYICMPYHSSKRTTPASIHMWTLSKTADGLDRLILWLCSSGISSIPLHRG